MPGRQKRMGMTMNDKLSRYLEGAHRIAIAGHTRPDGGLCRFLPGAVRLPEEELPSAPGGCVPGKRA